ncbi:MAG: DNA polymerase III subunit alpha, partial [Tissierellia bacterium]|nr:DNA polymerase III subunit alpha [Tissierellia bacterium]
EKEMLGIYISGHPLKPYEDDLKRISTITTAELFQIQEQVKQNLAQDIDGKRLTIGGIVVLKKNMVTKNNNMMAFITLEDIYGAVECIVFPATYDRYSRLIEEDSLIVIDGKISMTEEDEPKIICERITGLDEFNRDKIYLKISKEKSLDTFNEIKGVLTRYKGKTPVYVYVEKQGRMMMAQRDLWVNLDQKSLIEELIQILGKGNVKVS